MPEIYLDNNATTHVDPAVVRAMLPYLEKKYGNPSSLHKKGFETETAVRKAREAIARVLGVKAPEIIFTSGATEADNLAITGAARALGHRGRHIITTAVEHPAVLEPCRALLREGFKVDYLAVTQEGIDAERLQALITPETILISIMHVQNETGQIFPINDLAEAVRVKCQMLNVRCPIFHSDGAQALGKIRINLKNIDLYSLSAHKIHGPKGIGALYVRDTREILKVRGTKIIKDSRPLALEPLIAGGGQEQGIRSGTENVPGIAGFAKAADLAYRNFPEKQRRFKKLNAILLHGLKGIPDLVVNTPESSVETTVNISIPPLSGEEIVRRLSRRGVYIGSGSACASKHATGHSALSAMHLPRAIVNSSIRISFSRFNTEAEVRAAAKVIKELTAT